MFYCNDCAKEKNYPISGFKSHGKCEICKEVHQCNDVPSKDLPISEKDKCPHKKTVALNEEGNAGIFCVDCGEQLEKEC